MKMYALPIGSSVPSFLRPPPLPAALELLEDPLSAQLLQDADLRSLHLDLDVQARDISVKESRVRMMLGKLQRARTEVGRAIVTLQKVSRHRRRLYADFVREEYDCRSPLGKRSRALAEECDSDSTLAAKHADLPPRPFVRRCTQRVAPENEVTPPIAQAISSRTERLSRPPNADFNFDIEMDISRMTGPDHHTTSVAVLPDPPIIPIHVDLHNIQPSITPLTDLDNLCNLSPPPITITTPNKGSSVLYETYDPECTSPPPPMIRIITPDEGSIFLYEPEPEPVLDYAIPQAPESTASLPVIIHRPVPRYPTPPELPYTLPGAALSASVNPAEELSSGEQLYILPNAFDLHDLRNALQTPQPEHLISTPVPGSEQLPEVIAEAKNKRSKLPTIKLSAMKRQLEAYQKNENIKARIQQAMKPFRTSLGFRKKPIELPEIVFYDASGNAGRRKPRRKSVSKRHNPISKQKRASASTSVDKKVDAEKFLQSVALEIQVNEIADLMEGFDLKH